jgi:hypothetical protein
MLGTLGVAVLLFTIAFVLEHVAGCAFDGPGLSDYLQLRMQTLPGNTTDEKCSMLAGRTVFPDKSEYPSVKLFLFHHEEPELLTDWLQYHAYIFGLKNLHVLDHHSADEQICRALTLYKACGVHVESFTQNFTEKAQALTGLMKKYNDSFLVPLDADEFIVNPIRSPHNDDVRLGIRVDRGHILTVFKNLLIDGRKYKFDAAYIIKYDEATCNASLAYQDHRDPTFRRVMNPGFFAWDSDNLRPAVRKTFYYSDGFINTDQGNHHGEVVNDNHHANSWFDRAVKANVSAFFHFTDLSLFHMYFPSYYGQRLKVIRGAEAYGHNENTNCSKVGQGQPYCFLAQIYRKDDKVAHDKYMAGCSASPRDILSTWVFRRWFEKNTMSLQELVGVV